MKLNNTSCYSFVWTHFLSRRSFRFRYYSRFFRIDLNLITVFITNSKFNTSHPLELTNMKVMADWMQWKQLAFWVMKAVRVFLFSCLSQIRKFHVYLFFFRIMSLKWKWIALKWIGSTKRKKWKSDKCLLQQDNKIKAAADEPRSKFIVVSIK